MLTLHEINLARKGGYQYIYIYISYVVLSRLSTMYMKSRLIDCHLTMAVSTKITKQSNYSEHK